MECAETKSHILSKKSGKHQIRFKIAQVSSHHQRRRFCLKLSAISDASIGPCVSSPILVLSKRNKQKIKKRKNKKREKQKQVVAAADEHPSISKFRANPRKYFEGTQSRKKRLIQCLRLCQDTFDVLSARTLSFGDNKSAKAVYRCSFCHRFSRESPSLIPHYSHCQIVKVLDVLKRKESQKKLTNAKNN